MIMVPAISSAGKSRSDGSGVTGIAAVAPRTAAGAPNDVSRMTLLAPTPRS